MINLARDFKKGQILTFFSAEIKLKVSCYFRAFKSQQAHKERNTERHYAHSVKGKILHEPMKDKHSAVIMHSCFSPLCVICTGFWSDSDECNSDIEAALRPQPFNTNADDFDDFCD